MYDPIDTTPFVAFQVPTTAEWNVIWDNDQKLADGTGIEDIKMLTRHIANDNVTDAKLIYGKLRSRRGGSATNWTTPGTTNYDYSGTNVFLQCGVVTGAGDGVDVAVTFPTAYNQIPIVVCSIVDLIASNAYALADQVTTTGFNARNLTNGAAGGNYIAWIAIGE